MPRTKKQPLIGNGMNANLLKEFIDLSYKGNTSIAPAGYDIDSPLSDSRVKVYAKKGSNDKDIVVTHRGSVGLDDWMDNASYLFRGKVKGTKTYNLHRERHKRAVDKYGAKNIIAIGHSRAGLYLQELQKEFPIKENITYNKASGFFDIGRQNDANQTDIRVGNDVVSLLAPLQKRPNEIVKIDGTKNPFDFNTAHQASEIDKLGTTFVGKKEEAEGGAIKRKRGRPKKLVGKGDTPLPSYDEIMAHRGPITLVDKPPFRRPRPYKPTLPSVGEDERPKPLNIDAMIKELKSKVSPANRKQIDRNLESIRNLIRETGQIETLLAQYNGTPLPSSLSPRPSSASSSASSTGAIYGDGIKRGRGRPKKVYIQEIPEFKPKNVEPKNVEPKKVKPKNKELNILKVIPVPQISKAPYDRASFITYQYRNSPEYEERQPVYESHQYGNNVRVMIVDYWENGGWANNIRPDEKYRQSNRNRKFRKKNVPKNLRFELDTEYYNEDKAGMPITLAQEIINHFNQVQDERQKKKVGGMYQLGNRLANQLLGIKHPTYYGPHLPSVINVDDVFETDKVSPAYQRETLEYQEAIRAEAEAVKKAQEKMLLALRSRKIGEGATKRKRGRPRKSGEGLCCSRFEALPPSQIMVNRGNVNTDTVNPDTIRIIQRANRGGVGEQWTIQPVPPTDAPSSNRVTSPKKQGAKYKVTDVEMVGRGAGASVNPQIAQDEEDEEDEETLDSVEHLEQLKAELVEAENAIVNQEAELRTKIRGLYRVNRKINDHRRSAEYGKRRNTDDDEEGDDDIEFLLENRDVWQDEVNADKQKLKDLEHNKSVLEQLIANHPANPANHPPAMGGNCGCDCGCDTNYLDTILNNNNTCQNILIHKEHFNSVPKYIKSLED